MLNEAQVRLDRIVWQLKTAVSVNFYAKVVKKGFFGDKYSADVYPDGSICISYDLINILNNDELAAILAHEIAHLESLDRNKVIMALNRYHSWGILFKLRFGSNETKLIQKLLHQEEFYADARAVQILRKSGFKTTGMAGSLKKILLFSEGIDWWVRNKDSLTHPGTNRRIATLSELI